MLTIFLFSGCSHKITLEDRINNGKLSLKDNKQDITVGYYISSENLNKIVTSPAGGGDSVSYLPYYDIKPMLEGVLKSIFTDVQFIPNINKVNSNIKYIFTPKIETKSSSSSILYWPPERFTVILSCNANDENNKNIFETEVIGHGFATFEQFKNDFSYSSKKASKEALHNLYNEIINNSIFAADIKNKSIEANKIKEWR